MPNGDELTKHNKAASLASIDIKLAVLCERQANSQKIQTSINNKMEKHIDLSNKRLREIERCAEGVTKNQDDNKNEINRLRNKSNAFDIILAVGTAVLGALGINNK